MINALKKLFPLCERDLRSGWLVTDPKYAYKTRSFVNQQEQVTLAQREVTEETMVLYCLVVTVMCFVCLGFCSVAIYCAQSQMP